MSENITVAKLMTQEFKTGPLMVNFTQNRIVLNGSEQILQPKVLELLIHLCAAKGQTLSRETLVNALWPDTIVGPESLANTMARLRKNLDDNAKNPTFIETVQRKGYRWLLPLALNDKDEPEKQNKTEPAIAVKNEINAESTTETNTQKTLPRFRLKTILLTTTACLALAFGGYMALKPKPEPKPEPKPAAEFPFPDLHIQKLDDGGYEIQVGIEGELTEEKKAAMLKELKRITGEEHSGMEFTVDDVKPGVKPDFKPDFKQKCDKDTQQDGKDAGCNQ